MRPRLSIAGLAAFLVLDLALVVLALHPSDVAPAAAPAPVRTVSQATSPPTGVTTPAHPAPSPPPLPVYRAAPLTAMLVAQTASRAWRVDTGDCATGGGVVQTTSDKGVSWVKLKAPAGTITRIAPLPGQEGFVIAADKDCVLRRYVTNDEGRTWQGPGPVEGAWARQANDPTVVTTPLRSASKPCGKDLVIDLARVSPTQAEVLCRGGNVRRTTDGGVSWARAGRVPGGLALATRGEGRTLLTYVARVAATCSGIEIVTVGEKVSPSRAACLTSPGQADPGTVSLSTPPGAGWLAVGAHIWVSGPGLTSWKKT